MQVTVTVRDARGRLVGDLARSDFELSENGVPQRITHFDQGRVPVSLGVALDVSQSMYGQRMADAQQALRRFLVELLDPSDEAFLVVFNHDPHLQSPWTQGPSRAYARLEEVRPYGATAIYDALGMALPLFAARSHARAALVLISDGSDTASDATPTDVRRQIRRSDAFVYAVGIDAAERRPINDRVNTRLLREITGESGGYTEVIHDSLELAAATERIAEELRHQYTLGYTPSGAPRRALPPHPGPGPRRRLRRPRAPRLRRVGRAVTIVRGESSARRAPGGLARHACRREVFVSTSPATWRANVPLARRAAARSSCGRGRARRPHDSRRRRQGRAKTNTAFPARGLRISGIRSGRDDARPARAAERGRRRRRRRTACRRPRR